MTWLQNKLFLVTCASLFLKWFSKYFVSSLKGIVFLLYVPSFLFGVLISKSSEDPIAWVAVLLFPLILSDFCWLKEISSPDSMNYLSCWIDKLANFFSTLSLMVIDFLFVSPSNSFSSFSDSYFLFFFRSSSAFLKPKMKRMSS